jgi:hypothetical protein
LPPAEANGETTELLADRVVARAALANVVLRTSHCPAGSLHRVRLALLLERLWAEVSGRAGAWAREVAESVGRPRPGRPGAPPDGVEGDLLTAFPAWRGLPDVPVYLAAGKAERVKQYVFETPGLNETRGASTLLDAVTR